MLLRAQPKLGGSEQTIDNVVAADDAVVDEFSLALVAKNEKRRRFARAQICGELDPGLAAIVKCPDRAPRGRIAADPVAELQLLDRDANASLAFLTGEPGTVRFVARAADEIHDPIYALTIKNSLGQDVYVTNTLYKGMTVPALAAGNAVQVDFAVQLNLMPGEYFLSVGWVTHVGDQLLVIHRRYDAIKFAVLPVDRRIGIANLHSAITVTPLP